MIAKQPAATRWRLMISRHPHCSWLLGCVASLVACGGTDASREIQSDTLVHAHTIVGSNVFYYYRDLREAERFYHEVLGLRTVADFGFAKIVQVAPSSFLTLVDADSGMHSADEPKAVTLAIVTDQVEAWHDHLTEAGVAVRNELRIRGGQPHDGFVAVDPEGYLLEFERFNPHVENERLLPVLRGIAPLIPAVGDGALTISATVLWLYYSELEPIKEFYENALGLETIVDQGWAKVYPVSRTGFLGLVDGARGLHKATALAGVTVSFLTDSIEAWFRRMQGQAGFEFRTEELGDESGRVRTFVGFDPGGYFLEWDTFLDTEKNEELVALLRSAASR